MEFTEMVHRAVEIRRRYAAAERTQGRAWSGAELMQGFVVDVGQLTKLVMAKNGFRDVPELEAKLAHELADCLWSVLVLAEHYGVDLEKAFVDTMNTLEARLRSTA